MNHNITLFVTFLSLIVACQTPQKEREVVKEPSKAPQIDTLAQRYLELGRFSGTILVAKGDSILYNNSFGKADYEADIQFSDQTAFKIGNLTELITAYIIHKMAEEGKVDFTENISKYIPEILAPYTVQELLNHQSGLPSIELIKDAYPNTPYSTLKYVQLAKEVMNKVDYSKQNSGSELEYNILGLLIEKISGESYQKAIEQYLAELNLENTFYQDEKPKISKGYLYHNYRNQGLELEKSPEYTENEAFSAYGIKSTAKDLLKISTQFPDSVSNQSGFLMMDGFSWSLVKDLKNNMTIIVLSNRRHPISDELVTSIRAIYANQEYKLPLPRKVVEIDSELLKDYAGFYALDQNARFEVIVENDSLFVLMGPNKMSLLPQSENQFFLKDRDASMKFIKEYSQEVNKAILYDGFIQGDEVKKILE